MRFKDRREAGVLLGTALKEKNLGDDVVILALPRGGIPVAREISKILNAPLDLLFVKKVGAPGQPELAIGAVSESGDSVWQNDISEWFDSGDLEQLANEVKSELKKTAMSWRQQHPAIELAGKVAIIVDDGLATGATVKAAIELLKKKNPKKIIVAVPVGAPGSVSEIAEKAEIIALETPSPFFSVAQWYWDFSEADY